MKIPLLWTPSVVDYEIDFHVEHSNRDYFTRFYATLTHNMVRENVDLIEWSSGRGG